MRTSKMVLVNPLRYDSVQDVHRRLNATFINWGGDGPHCHPFFITNCYDDLTVTGLDLLYPKITADMIADLESKCYSRFHSSDVRLSLESPELGWGLPTNHRTGACPIYFLRSPTRQFSQGIDPRRVYWFDPSRDSSSPNIDSALSRGWSFRNSYEEYTFLARLIAGQENHSISEATSNFYGAPLNRKWALVNIKPDKDKKPTSVFSVFHESNAIGTFEPHSRVFFFARGLLTKTRRMEFYDILGRPENRGYFYETKEQD